MLWKIDGYLIIPHELLHVFAWWLVGKRCHYRIGDHSVRALEPYTLRQKIFVLLFPLMVILGSALLFMLVWAGLYIQARYPINPLHYFQVAPLWHQTLWVASVLLLLYSGSATLDIIVVCRLLFKKLRHQPPENTNEEQRKRECP